MLTLFHHPICPHSRFVRLMLEEYNQPPRLVEERVWERRAEFLELNPAGTTPVLVEEGAPPVPGAAVIAEYIDEVVGTTFGKGRLLPLDANAAHRGAPADELVQRKILRRSDGPAGDGTRL